MAVSSETFVKAAQTAAKRTVRSVEYAWRFTTRRPGSNDDIVIPVVDEIESLRGLSDGYDGPDSKAPSDATIEQTHGARRFITHLYRIVCKQSLPAPDISPRYDGGVEILWNAPTFDLLVVVNAEAEPSVKFGVLRNDGKKWDGHLADFTQYAELVQKLVQPQ